MPTKRIRHNDVMKLPPLPEEIQTEILLRSDVKSLMQLKVVCKSWNSLVKDPSFISQHKTLQTKESSTRILMVPRSGESSSFNLPNLPLVNIMDINTNEHEGKLTARILTHSCEGLFLVGYYNRDNVEIPEYLAIVNPATREKRLLRKSNRFTGRSISDAFYGFGYDSETKDYKVVRMFHLIADIGEIEGGAEVYSISSDSWRQVHDMDARTTSLLRCSIDQYSVYAAGSSHWLMSSYWFRGGTRGIVSFDFRCGIFIYAPLPLRLGRHFNYGILPMNDDDDGSITLLMYSEFSRGDERRSTCRSLERVKIVPSDQDEGKGWSWKNMKRMELETVNDGHPGWSSRFGGDDRILFERRPNCYWVLHDVYPTIPMMRVDDIFIYRERLTTFVPHRTLQPQPTSLQRQR